MKHFEKLCNSETLYMHIKTGNVDVAEGWDNFEYNYMSGILRIVEKDKDGNFVEIK